VNTFFATTSFQFVSWRVCIMAGTSAGDIMAEQRQRQCQSLMRMRKGVSQQQQEHVNGVNANQRSNEVKYGRLI
jgi:hypothetical protein